MAETKGAKDSDRVVNVIKYQRELTSTRQQIEQVTSDDRVRAEISNRAKPKRRQRD